MSNSGTEDEPDDVYEEGMQEEEEEEDQEEENGAVNQGGGPSGEFGVVGASATVVNEQAFDDLVLPPDMVQEVQAVWTAYLRAAESRDAAGEAIYACIFDAAPSMQSLFKTPRAVMAMRFMNGLNQIITNLSDPKGLKVVVETLGFQHLDLEVTSPRVVIFRDAIVDLLGVEMGAQFTRKARTGWQCFLNYVGGAYIYVRVKFSDRIRILASSWCTANGKARDELADMEAAGGAEENGEKQDPPVTGEEQKSASAQRASAEANNKSKPSGRGRASNRWGWGNEQNEEEEALKGAAAGGKLGSSSPEGNFTSNTSVPTTYNEMFAFNAAVMGFGQNVWMQEVISSFDTIVLNVSNSYRLQEECDVLSLRLAKYKGTINLNEYKAVMLASLRSLVPKDWDSSHEVAWSWLWENVERLLQAGMGKPAAQERALERLFTGLDETQQAFVRREVYKKFFNVAPAGQDFFKQSTTRLHFIADRIVSMTLEIYKDPKKMVEDISALGLRHVGYGVPTELFGPFVSACVQVIRQLTEDDIAEEAFRWSLSLVSRVLTRVITEGSTIVMKAINVNSGKLVRKAISNAPRGARSMWMLNIQVGTQSISPLLWAIETGSLEAARAITADLLTIRADRDHYYYGADEMFGRHPDIIKHLCTDAPAILRTLLDGLVWRSRTTERGQRRVNYYVKHLLVDSNGQFAQAIEWLTDHGDPKIITHPVLVLITDVVWGRVAFQTFLYGKCWFLFTLVVFIISEAILKRVKAHRDDSEDDEDSAFALHIAIFCCRCFIYLFSMGSWLYFHASHIIQDVRQKNFEVFMGCRFPAYLENWQDLCSLTLTFFLLAMFCSEPILYCLPQVDDNKRTMLSEHCDAAKDVTFMFSLFSGAAILCYYTLLLDFAAFSTRVSALVLVAFQVLSQLGLYLRGVVFITITFASAASALDQDHEDFDNIPIAALSFCKIALGMYDQERMADVREEPVLLGVVFVFVIITAIFLLNLLIAQITCSYTSTYEDMFGLARLSRGQIITKMMRQDSFGGHTLVPPARWQRFISSLHLDERCEFGEGDIGLAGGIQVMEPASANITTVDMIRRFGGSTSKSAQWPEEELAEDEDQFERLEKVIEKALKRSGSSKRRRGGGTTSSGGGSAIDAGSSEHYNKEASKSSSSVHSSEG